jgi:phosphatidylethanolamine-binding protein (PEBP) family uncharacterized protein
MPPSPPKGSGVHHYITENYELNTMSILKGFNPNNRSEFRIGDFRKSNKLPTDFNVSYFTISL